MQYHWLGDMGSCEERAVSWILAQQPMCLEAYSRTTNVARLHCRSFP